MSNNSDYKYLLEATYNLMVGVDYDQPTSLGSDLDIIADAIISAEIVPPDFEPESDEGFLDEVLKAVNINSESLADAIKACQEIKEILGRIDYGCLGKGDAERLEKKVEVLVGELESYINENFGS